MAKPSGVDGHPTLSWVTRQLFRSTAKSMPNASCRICSNEMPPNYFSKYRQGQAGGGCSVVITNPEAAREYDELFASVRLRMTNLDANQTSDDLKITFTTRVFGEQNSAHCDVDDIRTTRTIYKVSTLPVETFRKMFIAAVNYHYANIPHSSRPLAVLVYGMFEQA